MQTAELDVSTRESYEGYIRRTIMPALGGKQLRKIRGPVLDTFYARLRRCSDLSCTGQPFTEHRSFPALDVKPGHVSTERVGSSAPSWPDRRSPSGRTGRQDPNRSRGVR
jgi:Phage integrase, N-terminal SAM-like domain